MSNEQTPSVHAAEPQRSGGGCGQSEAVTHAGSGGAPATPSLPAAASTRPGGKPVREPQATAKTQLDAVTSRARDNGDALMRLAANPEAGHVEVTANEPTFAGVGGAELTQRSAALAGALPDHAHETRRAPVAGSFAA
jgi:hypothetical protein